MKNPILFLLLILFSGCRGLENSPTNQGSITIDLLSIEAKDNVLNFKLRATNNSSTNILLPAADFCLQQFVIDGAGYGRTAIHGGAKGHFLENSKYLRCNESKEFDLVVSDQEWQIKLRNEGLVEIVYDTASLSEWIREYEYLHNIIYKKIFTCYYKYINKGVSADKIIKYEVNRLTEDEFYKALNINRAEK